MSREELLQIAKPLICNTDVAKSFADKRKTQTRRLPKSESSEPRYKKGDILWIREPAKIKYTFVKEGIDMMEYIYSSDESTNRINIPKKHLLKKWVENKKGIPNGCIKEMARMFYRVVNVRCEDLQDISIDDIIAEGFIPSGRTQGEDRDSGYEWWEDTWNATAPKSKKWDDAPLVEVYDLERIIA